MSKQFGVLAVTDSVFPFELSLGTRNDVTAVTVDSDTWRLSDGYTARSFSTSLGNRNLPLLSVSPLYHCIAIRLPRIPLRPSILACGITTRPTRARATTELFWSPRVTRTQTSRQQHDYTSSLAPYQICEFTIARVGKHVTGPLASLSVGCAPRLATPSKAQFTRLWPRLGLTIDPTSPPVPPPVTPHPALATPPVFAPGFTSISPVWHPLAICCHQTLCSSSSHRTSSHLHTSLSTFPPFHPITQGVCAPRPARHTPRTEDTDTTSDALTPFGIQSHVTRYQLVLCTDTTFNVPDDLCASHRILVLVVAGSRTVLRPSEIVYRVQPAFDTFLNCARRYSTRNERLRLRVRNQQHGETGRFQPHRPSLPPPIAISSSHPHTLISLLIPALFSTRHLHTPML